MASLTRQPHVSLFSFFSSVSALSDFTLGPRESRCPAFSRFSRFALRKEKKIESCQVKTLFFLLSKDAGRQRRIPQEARAHKAQADYKSHATRGEQRSSFFKSSCSNKRDALNIKLNQKEQVLTLQSLLFHTISSRHNSYDDLFLKFKIGEETQHSTPIK